MDSQKEMLSFMDLMDLDEEVVDKRLRSIMERSNYTNTHLANALQLLFYKHLINKQENTECNNVDEYDFAAKLIKNINDDIVDNVCRITNIVLKLNPTTLYRMAEHLVSQISYDIDSSFDQVSSDTSENEKLNTLLYLKVFDSVLDAVIEQGEKLSMVYFEIPLERILNSPDEQLKIHFLTNSVPKLFQGIERFDIFTSLWEYLQCLQGESRSTALKVLSSLSDYYLPAAVGIEVTKYQSTLVYSYNFWNIVLYGLMSIDPSLRKISVYLTKRAIDYLMNLKINLNVKSGDLIIFSWDHSKSNLHKSQWDNFFILMDSLEEKQSNIVLPSLQLFDIVSEIGHHWLMSAYNIGLRHDNSQVRLKCVEYRTKMTINTDSEATVLLQALDDINFFENIHECSILKKKMSSLLKHDKHLIHVLKAIPQAHLSPVPFYHLTDMLVNLEISINLHKDDDITQIIIDILKASCNIIAVRKAIHINIAQFVGQSCKKLNWKDVASIISTLQLETKTLEDTENPILSLISDLELHEADKKEFVNHLSKLHSNIDIGMLYLDGHSEDLNLFIDRINDKIKIIRNIVNRQYSNKAECFNDVLYLITLLNKCDEKNNKITETIKILIKRENKMILQYLFSLISSDVTLSIDETKALFDNQFCKNADIASDVLIQLYKTSVIYLKDPSTDLGMVILSMFIVNSLSGNSFLITNYKHEMLDLKCLLQLETAFAKREAANAKSLGRSRNMFYEKHCETVYRKLEGEEINIANHVKELVDYVEKVMDCGGYGCLKWILKIVNRILKNITDSQKVDFNVIQFITRTWTEIEELKTNHQYSPCMKEFVNLITQQALIDKPEYNNIILLYCNKVIEYGPVKNSPLYYLVVKLYDFVVVKKVNEKNINEYGHLVYILSEILLYCPVPRKDQRIADNLALDILKNPKFGVEKSEIDLHFNYEIQLIAISILTTIHDSEALKVISSIITSKIDNIFKSKLRYHGNSQIHRTFQTGLQNLLLIFLLKSNVGAKKLSDWCIDLLGRLPHQLSVRICLEWFVTLYFYTEKVSLNDGLVALQSKNVSLASQFTIMYWLLKRKIANGSASKDEYEFAMDTLLSHTMGQLFNIRLLAQYLATKLHKDDKTNTKYRYIVQVIEKTLEENAKDKSFVKLKEDYFVNEFDFIANWTPYFIYYLLPRLCEVSNNEAVDTQYVLDTMKEINTNVERNSSFKEWVMIRRKDEELFNIELNRRIDKNIQEDAESMGTIQKKYIPWKSMSDISVYNVEKKRESSSDLIVVASLIDKLPNLGGMARTSEVFGVKTYVIDSLRHLQDKQFQGLSVSAERWINVEEVRPGQPLKEYLNRKKAAGYSIVAAEQTSTSTKLQKFKFPRKTLLLLGHEKEGVPCDLLPMMDHCVEIPQQGFVRSLNVHVTAAIFVWEYARQNLL